MVVFAKYSSSKGRIDRWRYQGIDIKTQDRHDKSIHFVNLQSIFDCLHDRQIAELLSVTRRLTLVN